MSMSNVSCSRLSSSLSSRSVFMCPSAVCLSICRPVYLLSVSVGLSAACLSVCVRLPVCLSACLCLSTRLCPSTILCFCLCLCNRVVCLVSEIPGACHLQGVALHDQAWRAPAQAPAEDAVPAEVSSPLPPPHLHPTPILPLHSASSAPVPRVLLVLKRRLV